MGPRSRKLRQGFEYVKRSIGVVNAIRHVHDQGGSRQSAAPYAHRLVGRLRESKNKLQDKLHRGSFRFPQSANGMKWMYHGIDKPAGTELTGKAFRWQVQVPATTMSLLIY